MADEQRRLSKNDNQSKLEYKIATKINSNNVFVDK